MESDRWESGTGFVWDEVEALRLPVVERYQGGPAST
jgi:hypothetical protein